MEIISLGHSGLTQVAAFEQLGNGVLLSGDTGVRALNFKR